MNNSVEKKSIGNPRREKLGGCHSSFFGLAAFMSEHGRFPNTEELIKEMEKFERKFTKKGRTDENSNN